MMIHKHEKIVVHVGPHQGTRKKEDAWACCTVLVDDRFQLIKGGPDVCARTTAINTLWQD